MNETALRTTPVRCDTQITIWALIGTAVPTDPATAAPSADVTSAMESYDRVMSAVSAQQQVAGGCGARVALALREQDLPHGGWASEGLFETVYRVSCGPESQEAEVAAQNSALWAETPEDG